jgi:hypothetical protein
MSSADHKYWLNSFFGNKHAPNFCCSTNDRQRLNWLGEIAATHPGFGLAASRGLASLAQGRI